MLLIIKWRDSNSYLGSLSLIADFWWIVDAAYRCFYLWKWWQVRINGFLEGNRRIIGLRLSIHGEIFSSSTKRGFYLILIDWEQSKRVFIALIYARG